MHTRTDDGDHLDIIPDGPLDDALLQRHTQTDETIVFKWVYHPADTRTYLRAVASDNRTGLLRDTQREVTDLWNQHAERNVVAKVVSGWSFLNQQRLRRLMADGNLLCDLLRLIPILHMLPFYCGKNDTHWCVTLWWLLEKRDKIPNLVYMAEQNTTTEGFKHARRSVESPL